MLSGAAFPPEWEWDYERHPGKGILHTRTAEILSALASGAIDAAEVAADSRDIHRRLFSGLTPPGHDYFAGHYRGEDYPRLRHYPVGVAADPRVGYPPSSVAFAMADLAREVTVGLAALDASNALPAAQLSDEAKFINAVVFSCRVFELFLRIHPYANGNGHAARFVLWCILGRYGHWPIGWPLHPKPQDPPYSDLITQYRNGQQEPLERFIIQACS